eukprot:TRINITY_DN13581_c0_g1_i2.p1 TRINITY_DN13581_c0_g1~~TRINITY_DN13581_c0_g1_i2.p1  ORF type:complete len:334 (+),score=36.34 TRINITY_DN13581_c0_g1_i2:30-1004(+)
MSSLVIRFSGFSKTQCQIVCKKSNPTKTAQKVKQQPQQQVKQGQSLKTNNPKTNQQQQQQQKANKKTGGVNDNSNQKQQKKSKKKTNNASDDSELELLIRISKKQQQKQRQKKKKKKNKATEQIIKVTQQQQQQQQQQQIPQDKEKIATVRLTSHYIREVKLETTLRSEQTLQISSTAQRRLMQDLRRMQKDPPPGTSCKLVKDNLREWSAVIVGPSNSPFQNRKFRLKITFTNSYPIQPPLVRFSTKIFHPNVYRDGTICMDVLQGRWSPVCDVATILTTVQALMIDPNTSSPANQEAARLYVQNRAEYDKIARGGTNKQFFQ